MYPDSKKRKWLEAFNPWSRDQKPRPSRPEDSSYLRNYNVKQRMFRVFGKNEYLDIYTKRVALKVSASVVSLQSYSGEEELFQGSGTIIESGNTYSTILTSASLVMCPKGRYSVADDIKVIVHLSDGRSLDGQIEGFNFHYNIAALKIQSDSPLQTVSLVHINDSFSIDPSDNQIIEKKSFRLRPPSDSYNLIPGDSVVVLGRFFVKPYNIMVAPGEFSLDRCDYDCKELFNTTCQLTRCGTGGPVINRYGEVIGICFHDVPFAAFLPINVAYAWWECYKKSGQSRLPWLGMETTNLYTASIEILERIYQKFPTISKGVIVEEVVPGSSADSAGIKHNDVIIQFGGSKIESFLEFFGILWNKIGETVELIVIREGTHVPLHLSMLVDEATSDNLYSWPIPL